MHLFIILTAPCNLFSMELFGWHHGEYGYKYAMDNSKENEAPVILFFYLDSDKYCQELKDVYFSAYDVYSFLNEIPKADINLKGNEFEIELAKKYNTELDPSLMILFPFTKKDPVRITPFLREKDMTPKEFSVNLKKICALTYNDMGYSYFIDRDYENAIKYYDFSIRYNPEQAYPLFAIGSVYHAMAVEKRDLEYIKKADEYYKKALKLDPEYKECKEELEKLNNNKAIISK